MDASELDRLGSSVKQIVERLTKVEEDRAKLRDEKRNLESRLQQHVADTNRIAETASKSSVADEQLQEVKTRILALAKRLGELEETL